MKLHTKLILSLLSGLLTVFISSQLIQSYLQRTWQEKFSGENAALLAKREQLRVENIFQTAHPVVMDFIENGEMGKLDSLMRVYTNTDGLLEFSLYDSKGVAAYSSSRSIVKAKTSLDPEVKSRLLKEPTRLSRVTSNAFEVYQPVAVSSKCIECHDDLKPGTCGCFTVLKVSNESMMKTKASWKASEQRMEHLSLATAGITTLVITLFFIVLSYFVIRRLIAIPLSRVVGHLEGASSLLDSTTGQFQVSSQLLAEGAARQAANLEETSSSLQQMTTMTSYTMDLTQKAKDLTNQSRVIGDSAMTEMQSMSLAMDAIKSSSDDIAKILKTIEEIAFQTNILALNAAVEAARAGEAGLGFAVVADEVRNLAQRCTSAAHEVEAKIEDSIGKGVRGVEISAKVARSLGEIVSNARQVDELVSKVAQSSQEQNQGIAQINNSVHHLDQVTQSNSRSAEETASASDELMAQARAIDEAIFELERLVKGKVSHPSLESAPGPRPPLQPVEPMDQGDWQPAGHLRKKEEKQLANSR